MASISGTLSVFSMKGTCSPITSFRQTKSLFPKRESKKRMTDSVWIIETRAKTPPQFYSATAFCHCSLKSDALTWMRELKEKSKVDPATKNVAHLTQWRVVKYRRV